MFSNSEEQRLAETEVFEGFIRNYESYKQYLVEATEEEKQTPRYQHMKTIVKGLDAIYPKLTADMKTVFDMRYGSDYDQYDFADIADEIFATTTKAKRLRDIIIREFAVAIGWHWAV